MLFDPGRVGRQSVTKTHAMTDMGGYTSPSLDLVFDGSALDPRITFTRASIATYFDATGTIQTATTNAPRFDYDPVTHVLRGLLIEDARQNILVYSSNYVSGGWGWGAPQGSTLTPGQAGSPDGAANFSLLGETTANSAHYLGIPLGGLTASATYTLSLYIRRATGRYMQLAFTDGGTNGGLAMFDLQTGVISGPMTAMGTGVIGAATMQPVGNGTFRCSITTTIGAATTGNVWIFMSNVPVSTWAPSYVGNAANGMLIFGAQLEQGAFPTSHIQTTGAAVTRANDYCMIPSANVSGWFVSPGGSWSAEFINLDPTTMVGKAPRIVCQAASAGSAPLWENPLVLSQFDGAVLSTANTIVPNVVSKGASTWAVGSAKICLNAGAIATSSSLPNGYPQLTTAGVAFLASGSGIAAESMTGYIRRVRYWPRVLSDAEMQSVTT